MTSFSSYFFDPKKSCGSFTRSKLGYQRKQLIEIAKFNGIRNASQMTTSTLCLLLKNLYYQESKNQKFVAELNIQSDIPIPVTMQIENATPLSFDNAFYIQSNPTILKTIKRDIQKLDVVSMDQESKTKLLIFVELFYPNSSLFQKLDLSFAIPDYHTKYTPLVQAFWQSPS